VQKIEIQSEIQVAASIDYLIDLFYPFVCSMTLPLERESAAASLLSLVYTAVLINIILLFWNLYWVKFVLPYTTRYKLCRGQA
jgi:hypothetical protein